MADPRFYSWDVLVGLNKNGEAGKFYAQAGLNWAGGDTVEDALLNLLEMLGGNAASDARGWREQIVGWLRA